MKRCLDFLWQTRWIHLCVYTVPAYWAGHWIGQEMNKNCRSVKRMLTLKLDAIVWTELQVDYGWYGSTHWFCNAVLQYWTDCLVLRGEFWEEGQTGMRRTTIRGYTLQFKYVYWWVWNWKSFWKSFIYIFLEIYCCYIMLYLDYCWSFAEWLDFSWFWFKCNDPIPRHRLLVLRDLVTEIFQK